MKPVSSVLLLLVALLGACVTQTKYDDLKRQYDDAHAQLDQRGEEIRSLEGSLAEARAKVAELEQSVGTAKAELEELGKRKQNAEQEVERLTGEATRLTGELAQLLKDRARLRESAAELKNALAELARRKAEAERRVAEFRDLLAKFKNLIDAGKLQVKLVDGRMVLALPTDVLFDSGSAKLSTEGGTSIGEVARVLRNIKQRRFQVEGHTDNVPIHTAQYASNWELASARALGVVKALVEGGMDSRSLSAASYGEYHPLATNETPEGRAQNRRIEIVLVPDLSMLPGFYELRRIVEQH